MNIRTRARVALSALLLAVALPAAHAATYTGQRDPAYGGIFPSLGWKASAVFDVPDACLAVGTASNVPCAGFNVLSAQVQFYDIASPAAILGTYALSPGVNVASIDVAAGQLSGVQTNYFDAFVSPLAIAGASAYDFRLILEDDVAQLAYLPVGASTLCLSGPSNGRCGFSKNEAQGVFTAITPIPEPETWALMLAGLAGLGATARRRAGR